MKKKKSHNIIVDSYPCRKPSMPKNLKQTNADLTDSQKKSIKNANKAKANPTLSAAKKEKNDACRDRRAAVGSSKSFS